MNLHKAGRLAEAEGVYRQILTRNPDHPDALHLLGLIAYRAGRCREAEDLIRRASEIAPNSAACHCNLGAALQGQGKLDEAIASYRQAIRLQPDLVDVYQNLGNALKKQGKLDEAQVAYRRSLALQPDDPDVFNNLGNTFCDQGRLDEALAAYTKAVQLRPGFAEAHFNIGNTLGEQKNSDEALAAYARAIRLKPGFAEAYYNVGNVMRDRRELDQAVAAYSKAIQLNPDYHEADNNLGTILQDQGKTDAALAAYRRALALKPGWGDAQVNLAFLLLMTGRFEEGLREFELRWQAKGFADERRDLAAPRWNGEPLYGKTILLHARQGFGDTIQFIRYAPMVAARGGRVLLECREELSRFLRGAAGLEAVATTQPPPRFDVHCPLLSLPFIFETRMETIPASIPYLHADPELAKEWSRRIGRSRERLNVGLAWAGNPQHKQDDRRSIAFSQLTPLANVSGVTFYSLQKGPASSQAREIPAGMELIDLTSDLHDFADTAALIQNLDLVISVDTAVAHLAGAMAKPVWLLIAPRLDWRWFIDCQDSPWYPTMRLFRQKKDGDWSGVIARVVEALGKAKK